MNQDNEAFGDDPDSDELDEVISQTCSQTKPKSSNLEERMDQIESQQVDFTSSNTVPLLKGGNTIVVNPNQKQNPLLQNLRNTRFVFSEAISPAHYLLFDSCCALFLSLKYHVIHPDYVYERVAELQNKYQLKVLLVMIDHLVYEASLKELTLLAVRTNFTLLLAWNYEEAAKHIENIRLNVDKPPDVIMGRGSGGGGGGGEEKEGSKLTTNQGSLVDALTSVKSINRTDAITLLATFDSLANIATASPDELTICPGISIIKARRLHSLFRKPFIKSD